MVSQIETKAILSTKDVLAKVGLWSHLNILVESKKCDNILSAFFHWAFSKDFQRTEQLYNELLGHTQSPPPPAQQVQVDRQWVKQRCRSIKAFPDEPAKEVVAAPQTPITETTKITSVENTPTLSTVTELHYDGYEDGVFIFKSGENEIKIAAKADGSLDLSECKQLKNLIIDGSIPVAGQPQMRSDYLKNVILPSGNCALESVSLTRCHNLTGIDFSGRKNLSTVNVRSCDKIAEIVLSKDANSTSNMTEIGISECKNLTTIKFPAFNSEPEVEISYCPNLDDDTREVFNSNENWDTSLIDST
jgi:hypothetical protein